MSVCCEFGDHIYHKKGRRDFSVTGRTKIWRVFSHSEKQINTKERNNLLFFRIENMWNSKTEKSLLYPLTPGVKCLT